LQQSESWERILLQGVLLEFTPHDSISKITSHYFTACSNSSATTSQGTFGWVIALPDKTRLATGSGPVDRHEPQSFRAEAQGMLSLVCFLGRLLKWTSSTTSLIGILATDNSGLVDQAKEQTKIWYAIRLGCSGSYHCSSGTSPPSGYISTHERTPQDKDTMYALLPFLAQSNCNTDKSAGAYQLLHGSHRPIIPLSPTRPTALDFAGRMKTAIRDAAHSGPLLDRMRMRNSWPAYVPAIINWDTHRLSTMVHQLMRSHLAKLCHGYLPAGKIAHWNNPSFPDSCLL
jgi:hypothetical protein